MAIGKVGATYLQQVSGVAREKRREAFDLFQNDLLESMEQELEKPKEKDDSSVMPKQTAEEKSDEAQLPTLGDVGDKFARYQYQPKYIQEMSQEEWENLLDRTDVGIEEGKEVSRMHKEEAEKKAKVQDTEEESIWKKAEKIEEEKEELVSRTSLRDFLEHPKKFVPYGELADENGIVEYKGVIFQCDYEAGALCLGDVSNEKNVLTIPLEKGGCLKVNRDNLGDLSRAIGMFSPADVNRIMRAIAQDAKVRQMEQEIEEDKASVGKSAEEHLDEKNS